MRHVTDRERRARLARRHALCAGAHVRTVEDAARSVVAFHATNPPSVHLAAWARAVDLVPGDVDRALLEDRTLVKQRAMRRTLFAFPRDLVPAVRLADRRTHAVRDYLLSRGLYASRFRLSIETISVRRCETKSGTGKCSTNVQVSIIPVDCSKIGDPKDPRD